MSKSGMKIKWNMAGFRAVRNAPRMLADIDRRTAAIEQAANAKSRSKGYKARKAEPGKKRARGSVGTTMGETGSFNKREEAKHHYLRSSIDAGRL